MGGIANSNITDILEGYRRSVKGMALLVGAAAIGLLLAIILPVLFSCFPYQEYFSEATCSKLRVGQGSAVIIFVLTAVFVLPSFSAANVGR